MIKVFEEDRINNFVNGFSISDKDRDGMKKFLRFISNISRNGGRWIPYGMLVEYEEEKDYKDFLNRFEDLFLEHGYDQNQMVSVSEGDLIKKSTQELIEKMNLVPGTILVVKECDNKGDAEKLRNAFAQMPELIRIVFVTKEIMEERFRKDAELYYRQLPVHISLGKVTSSEVVDQFLHEFETDFQLTDAFRDRMRLYVDTVYEGADYMRRAFIEDLKCRIYRKMMENGGISTYLQKEPDCKKVDIDLVPYSAKVELKLRDVDTKRPEPKVDEKLARKKAEIEALIKEEEKYATVPPSDRSKKNVVLLSLSKLSQIETNVFTPEESLKCYEKVLGRGQLDPIVKMLGKKLGKEGQCIDKVILLCTDVTLVEGSVYNKDDGSTFKDSAYEYLKKQVRKYVNPEIDEKEMFTVVPVQENNPERGIQEVIQVVRDTNKKCGEAELRLFLDTHGGLRGIQRILEAVVSLLRTENIEITEAYSVEFGINKMISEKERLGIFEFVSGMEEFKTSGKIDILQKYLGDQHKLLMKSLKQVANGIQWCNIADFQKGLINARKNFQLVKAESENSYMNIFIDNMENDFGILLQNHKVQDEIVWCMEKQYYQQALTLLESRIAWELHEEKVLEIDTGKYKQYENEKRAFELYYKSIKKKAELTDVLNGLVTTFSNDHRNAFKNNNLSWMKNEELPRQEFKKKFEKWYLKTCAELKNSKSMFETSLENITVQNKPKEKSEPSYISMKNAYLCGTKDYNTMCCFLYLHNEMKKARNDMNHAAVRPKYKTEAVCEGILFEIELIKKLEGIKAN